MNDCISPDLASMLLPIPDELPVWNKRDIVRFRGLLPGAVLVDGVLRWKSNDRPVPMGYFSDALLRPAAAQAGECDRSDREFVQAYRAAQAARRYSPEQLSEIRAELGPDAAPIDALTGKPVFARH